MPVIGFLNGFSLAAWASPVGGFHKGLSETGYVEGRNVVIEYRWAEGQYDLLPALASELVRRPVAVLVATGGSAAAHAAKAATTTIPIVFGIGTNPFKTGLITSLSRPVGNATWVWFLTGDLESKRLGLLHELVPNGAVIAVLFNPRNLNTATESKQLQVDAHTLGQPIHILHAGSDPEIDTAFGPFPSCARPRCWSVPIRSTSRGTSTSSRWSHTTVEDRDRDPLPLAEPPIYES